MVKSYKSKRHHKKHRGGEGETTADNSVLNMDEPASASVTETAAPETAAPETAAPETAAPETVTVTATVEPATAEEEKKGWFSSLFGGSKTKRVRFRMTRKHRRSAKRSGSKRSAKRSAKRSGSKKRKGSSRK